MKEGTPMGDYTIYALKGANDPCRNGITFRSLNENVGRFGWSYIKTADLTKLQARIEQGDSLTPCEWDCYHPFLLDIKDGDYVVYIDIPEWGKCTLAHVTGPYFWRYHDDDFNHCFPVESRSVRVFDRNDAVVHPQLSRKLKLRGKYWRIYDMHQQFESLIESLREGRHGQPRTMETSLDWLKGEIQSDPESITKKIHRTYPGADLENPTADAFRNVPGVKEVKEQGGAGERGADLRVIFEWEVPILGIQEQRTCVVRVKSFEGDMGDTRALEQIRQPLDHWDAQIGIIVSTASSVSEAFEHALEDLQKETGKPFNLVFGEDVAAFLLRFGSQLLF